MELGHACTLSETNSRGYVYICECGEVGTPQPSPWVWNDKTERGRWMIEVAQDAARHEHAQHCHDIGEQIAAEHAIAMANSAAYVRAVAPTVRRIGRWGAG